MFRAHRRLCHLHRNNPHKLVMLRLATKSYSRDLPWLDLALKSVLHFCTEPIEWHIVVDEPDVDDVRRLIDSAMKWGGERNDVKIFHYGLNKHWSDTVVMTGYYRQQAIKMTYHRIIDGIFWAWDSDTIAQRQFSSKDFLAATGKPILWFSQYNTLMGGQDDAAHRARQEVIKQIFHIPTASFEFMRGLPIPLNSAILKCGSARQEWSDSFNMLENSNQGFSEFCIIGEFTHQYFPDAVEWKNAETSGPTFSGGYKQGGEGSGSLDGVSITTQFWSWGGVKEDVKNWVNGLKK